MKPGTLRILKIGAVAVTAVAAAALYRSVKKHNSAFHTCVPFQEPPSRRAHIGSDPLDDHYRNLTRK